MSPFQIILTAGALITSAAALTALWSVDAPHVPSDSLDGAADEAPSASITFSSLARYFDRSNLPDPAPLVAVEAGAAVALPDPANALRQYRYLGMADSDGRKAAVFANAGATQLMRPGEQLEGFTLASFDAENALFELDDRHIRLSLAPK